MQYIEQDKNNYKNEIEFNDKYNNSLKPKINKRNNSYERMAITLTGGKSSIQIGEETGRIKEKFYKKYNNLKNSPEISKKEVLLNNIYFLNSCNNKNKMKINDNNIINIVLNRNINSSVVWAKNKNSLLNNNAKNSLINSINNSNKGNKLSNYFNNRNNRIDFKIKNNQKYSS